MPARDRSRLRRGPPALRRSLGMECDGRAASSSRRSWHRLHDHARCSLCQLRRDDEVGIDYTITPGVPSFAAAAAALGQELTLPELAQSVVLTRTSGRASAMPSGETLEA